MRVVIIGAGPCGLGAAYRLWTQGFQDFVVYEQRPHVGGLAASYRDTAGFTWDFAVHVAHSHYHYVDELMDRLLPDGFYVHERRSWVRLYGVFVPYPFQYNIRHLPADIREECLAGLRERPDQATPRNFEEWVLAGFGRGIARHFMLPYNRKLWAIDLREMGYQWIGDRVPTVDLSRIERNIAEGRDDVAWGPNHVFRFPRTGGTGAIWEALAASLPQDRLRLSCQLVGLDIRRREAVFSDGTREHYDHLISTIPLTRLAELTGEEPLIRAARELRYTHVYMVGVAPAIPLPKSLEDKTWIYVPEPRHVVYRVTPFSIFSPSHVPDPDRFCSLMCEISEPDHEPFSDRSRAEDALRSLRESGLLDPLPERIHIHELREEFGYPVPTVNRDRALSELLPALEHHGIYSRGRFGGWKYEVGNMDHSIMQGVEVADRILRGTPEITLFAPHIVNAGKR